MKNISNTHHIVDGKKQCSRCGEWLSISRFGKQKRFSSGLGSWCRDCRRKDFNIWRKSLKGKALFGKHNKKYREMPTSRQYQKQYYKEHRVKYYHKFRLKKFNLLVEEYENLLKNQNGCCGICGNQFTETPNIDHDHKTGKVRGLLCRTCNLGIGGLRDNIEILKKAIDYLSKSKN